jgi:hypothetical protein
MNKRSGIIIIEIIVVIILRIESTHLPTFKICRMPEDNFVVNGIKQEITARTERVIAPAQR